MSRLSSLAAITAVVLIATACGSSPNPAPTATASTIASGGTGVLPTIVSSELGGGPNRVLVSFLDATGTKPAGSPDRKVSVSFKGANGQAIPPQPATFIWAIQSVVGVYVVHATFPTAGAWTAEFTTSAPGSPKATIPFGFDVKARTDVVAPGDPAPSVATPTISSAGDVSKVSTDTN